MEEQNKSSMNNVHSREKRANYWKEFNNTIIETRARKRRNLANEEMKVINVPTIF